MIYFYALLKNNVEIKKKVHEDDRMAVETPLLIFHAKLNSCILWIRLLQNEHQWSANDFGPVSLVIEKWLSCCYT